MGASQAAEWHNAPEFGPYYIVSSLGHVRNIDTGKLLFGEIDRDGYRRVNLRRHGKAFKRRVHRLVCEAFHGPQPEGCEVCHIDGNRLNNRADNLMWGSRSENVQHSIAHGTHRPGRPPSKLSADQVRELRRKASEGRSERSLAVEFGVSPSQAHKVISREAWADVE